MKYLKIKDIGRVITGATPKTTMPEYWNGSIPWITPKEISKLPNQFVETTERHITELGLKSSSATLLPKGSILFTTRAPIGLIAIANIEVCTNQGFKSIAIDNNYSPFYIYYALKHNTRALRNLGVGSTFKELSKLAVEDFELPIPTIDEQLQIGNLLYKIERLIEARKNSIDNLHQYVTDTFLSLFGSPANNIKGFPTRKLEELGNWNTGGTPSRKTKHYFEGTIPWITSGELNELYISAAKEHINDEAIEKSNAKIIETGSLLLGMYDTAALKSSINKIPIACNQAIAYSKLDQTTCDTLYVFYCIQVGREFYKSQKRGVRQKNLNLSMIKEMEVMLPPLSLQRRFAKIVRAVENLKNSYQSSLNDLNALFDSFSYQVYQNEVSYAELDLEIPEDLWYGKGHEVKGHIENIKGETTEPLTVVEPYEGSIWLAGGADGQKTPGVHFSINEGYAVLDKEFKNKRSLFNFSEFEKFLKNELFEFTYSELREFFFALFQNGHISQVYASKDWVDSYRNTGIEFIPPTVEEISGEGSIWFHYIKEKKAK